MFLWFDLVYKLNRAIDFSYQVRDCRSYTIHPKRVFLFGFVSVEIKYNQLVT